MLVEEELRQAEAEAADSNSKLARVIEKNIVLSMMLYAVGELRRGRGGLYSVKLLRYYLEEVKMFTSEEFAENEKKPGVPLITPEFLIKAEKDEYDRLARSLAEQLEGDNRIEEPDAVFRQLKEYDRKGNGKIGAEGAKKLGNHVRRHAIGCAEEKLKSILTDHGVFPDDRKRMILELLSYLDDHEVPLAGFKGVDKHVLFKIGWQGLTESTK